MEILLIILAVVFAVGLLVFAVPILGAQKDRKVFLKEMAEVLEGDVEADSQRPGVFLVNFKYKNFYFIFEDILETGMLLNEHRAYLRVKLNTDLVLIFSEREKKTFFRETLALSSKSTDKALYYEELVNLPKVLQNFKLFTNDKNKFEVLISQPGVLKIIADLRSNDFLGTNYIPIKIIENQLVMDIYSRGPRKPNLLAFYTNPNQIDYYIKILANLAEIIAKLK